MSRAGKTAGGIIGRGIVAGVALAIPSLAGYVVKWINDLGNRIGGLPGRIIKGTVRRARWYEPGFRERGGFFERGGFKGAFQEGGVAQDMTRQGGVVAGAPMGVGSHDRVGNANVGPGEAVLTGEQQKPVQRALALAKQIGATAYGSLEELFAKVTTPHWATAADEHMGEFRRGGLSLGSLRGLARKGLFQRFAGSPLVGGLFGMVRNAPRGARFGSVLSQAMSQYGPSGEGGGAGDGGGGGSSATENLGRWLGALQGRFDLTEEEFVRDGMLSMPDIRRRARELNTLIGVARQIVNAARSAVSRVRRRGGNTAEAQIELFEAITQLRGLQQEREVLRPRNWPKLLAEAAGGEGDRFGDYRQRDFENLQRAFERSQNALSAFSGPPDIGAGRGANAFLASMHRGGIVPGTGERAVLAQGGERMMTRDAQSAHGDVLDAVERAAQRHGMGGSRTARGQGDGGITVINEWHSTFPPTRAQEKEVTEMVVKGLSQQGYRPATGGRVA